MMLRTTLFTALGVSVLAMSAHAQSRVPYSTTYVQVQAQADPEATGAITSESPSATGVVPSGSVPGYNDPYARDPYSRQQAVQSAPIAPPAGVQGQGQTQGYVQPGYGYQPGAQQAAAPSNQPMAITPPGATGSIPAQQPAANYGAQPGYQQGGYQQAQPSYQQQPVYQAQPGYAAAQPAEPPPAGGYAGSYQQDQLLQQARASQQGVAPAPQNASYAPGGYVRDAAPAPAGSYASNSPVVPGTTQAPSGPRIENVDPSEPVDSRFRRQTVDYVTSQPAGTIIIDTPNTYLYYVLGNGKAMRYGIGVGREGFTWQGTEKITRKAEWADWRPPAEMIERQPYLPRFMAGGPGNPLGARTLYLGSTIYRIHGTNEPQTIGKFVSSGCIRMLNDDVEDLYERVKVGTKVVIMPKTGSQSASAQTGAPTAQR
ncbi:L,D-transpeptidase [Aquabacter sp. P-9]|uniref:L,D-transpeptidase n=1 Tax=Aquabacter sediminis TaxID=3029197 RepID=UPI00237DDE05|nr:L,D-transpeptidase [Aquabacter sp. P-9]MDE1568213.1 L,D-transpeptidase family protein [Aquabacter sp. P-9]